MNLSGALPLHFEPPVPAVAPELGNIRHCHPLGHFPGREVTRRLMAAGAAQIGQRGSHVKSKGERLMRPPPKEPD